MLFHSRAEKLKQEWYGSIEIIVFPNNSLTAICFDQTFTMPIWML